MADGSASVGGALRAGLAEWRPALRTCWLALLLAGVLGVAAGWAPPGGRLIAGLATAVIVQGALYRRIFGRAPGLKGLRWGADEWRLLGAHLLVLCLIALIGAILLTVVGAVVLGWWLGVLVYLVPRRSELRVAGADTPGAVVAAISAFALVVAALWLQHCCRSPGEPTENGEPAPE